MISIIIWICEKLSRKSSNFRTWIRSNDTDRVWNVNSVVFFDVPVAKVPSNFVNRS